MVDTPDAGCARTELVSTFRHAGQVTLDCSGVLADDIGRRPQLSGNERSVKSGACSPLAIKSVTIGADPKIDFGHSSLACPAQTVAPYNQTMNRSLYGLRFGGLASPFYPPSLRPSKPGYRNRYPTKPCVNVTCQRIDTMLRWIPFTLKPSIVSHASARPSSDIQIAALQHQARECWSAERRNSTLSLLSLRSLWHPTATHAAAADHARIARWTTTGPAQSRG